MNSFFANLQILLPILVKDLEYGKFLCLTKNCVISSPIILLSFVWHKKSGLSEQIKASIEKRDEIDRNKKEGSLKIATDALYIDTSNLTIDNVCAIILKQIS